ncbi:DUF503 domain-containing protein [Marinilactibacillus sp. XAAS-LB27]|uniref:DUF503 domain-containing protein n=1 Tax=Marinilactibacillus sp. XAAS-LB27 TaxID=3114538 RepID=UPI002E16FE85|nr:DUF503 domain-containing protein [Marinilactibacillus sp. XAAS-LB27]
MKLMGIELTILIYDAYSLKDKRSVVKSILKKVSNQFNVSVAETDELDTQNRAVIGFGIVGNNSVLCEKILNQVIEYIEANYEVEITDIDRLAY